MFDEKWRHRLMLGILAYLTRNTRPTIEYAVHQYARFQCDPKLTYDNVIKFINRYIMQTRCKGIKFKIIAT